MYQIRSVIFLSLSFSKFWCHLSATLTHSNNWDRLEFHPELPASFNTQTNSRVVVMPSFCLIAQVNLTQGSVTVNHVKSWGIKIEGKNLHKQNVRWWDCPLSGHKVWCVSGTANSTGERCFIRPVSRNSMDWTGSLNWAGDTRLPTLVLCLLVFIFGSVLKEKKTCSTSTLM